MRFFLLLCATIFSTNVFSQVGTTTVYFGKTLKAKRLITDSSLTLPSDTTDKVGIKYIGGNLYYGNGISNVLISGGGGGSVAWGDITGLLSDQDDLTAALNARVLATDTAAMLAPYLREVDTASLSNRINARYTTPTGWTDYGGTSTITGFSSVTQATINYIQMGKVVFLQVYIIGTSNAAGFSFTIPFTTPTGAGNQSVMVHGVNNTTTQTNATLFIPANSSTVTVYLNNNVTTNAWTTSGTKRVEGFMILNVQ